MTGLIKVALALHHRELPASINCAQPNPRLSLDESPFRVQATREAWPAGTTPRRAGVSSFGVGGTNAHVVLEEYVATERTVGDGPALPRLLPISAKTPAALDAVAARLADHLDADAKALDPVAWTLADGREPYVERAFVVAADAADAARLLRAPAPALAGRARATASPAVAFLFPGQGAQHIGMARELHATDAGFRSIVDRCAELLLPLLGEDLRDALWPAGDREEAARRLTQTRLAQPALFVVQYALADLWMRWGVRPAALLGHSIGEFAAACHAGVFSLEDALALVAHRGRLLQAQPEGAMLSVRAAAEVVESLLPDDVSLAARNAPALCVVSGPHAAIAALQATLEARDIQCRALHTSHAFHSGMVEPAMAPFEALVRTVRLSPPRLPVVSCVTGTWLTAEQATDPAYWARHLRATVRFADGLATLRAAADHVFLEVGPRQGATALARSVPPGTPVPRAVSSLPDGEGAERRALLAAAGRLWTYGVSLDWAALHEPASRRRVPLPTYPFERHRHWVEQGDAPAGLALTDAGVAGARARATAAGRSDTSAAALSPFAVPATRDAAFLDDVIARQLALMQEQLALLQS